MWNDSCIKIDLKQLISNKLRIKFAAKFEEWKISDFVDIFARNRSRNSWMSKWNLRKKKKLMTCH